MREVQRSAGAEYTSKAFFEAINMKNPHVIRIVDISETTERTVTVVTVAGRERRLPRCMAEFWPGKVIIPMWLAATMARDQAIDDYFA